jgi:hypothetical protein
MEALPRQVDLSSTLEKSQPNDKKQKRQIVGVRIPTAEINHTNLMTNTINKGLNDGIVNRFHAQFRNAQKKKDKKLEDREHDEVIAMCTRHFDFDLHFEDVKTRREAKRYVIIYKEIKNNEEEIKKYKQQLEDIVKHNRRSNINYPVKIVDKLNEINKN